MRKSVTISMFVVSLALGAVGRAQGPSDSDWQWLNDHRTEAFDRLMPIASPPYQFVAYRSYRDLYQDVPESHFSISYLDGATLSLERVVATTTAPVGPSIQQQLLELHMHDREASFDTLLPRVAVQRMTLTGSQCPELKRRVELLVRTSLTIPRQDVIRLHGFQHRIVIDMLGIQMDASLNDPESPIVKWAAATSKALGRCKAG